MIEKIGKGKVLVMFMFFSIIFATMFFGVRYGGALILTCFTILIMVSFGVSHGWISYDFNIETAATNLSSWISHSFAFVLFSTILIMSLGRLITYLVDSSSILKERTAELQKTNDELLEIISEKNKAEEALQQSEEKHRLLAENASDVIWTADLNLNITYISPSVQRVRGYTVEEATDMTMPNLTGEKLAIEIKRIRSDVVWYVFMKKYWRLVFQSFKRNVFMRTAIMANF